jgi:hypothetical protein
MAFVVSLFVPPRQTAHIAMPPGDATPAQVVAVYLDAMAAHDCETFEALRSPDPERGWAWCQGLSALTDVQVLGSSEWNPTGSGLPTTQEYVWVGVEFDPHWRRTWSAIDTADPAHGFNAGVNPWGYVVTRPSPDAPWRIITEGFG